MIASKKLPGGGAFISYDFGGCDCFVPSIRFDAIGLADTAEHHFREEQLGDNVQHQAALRWALDLSFQPGFIVNDYILGYCKGGVTLGGVREQAWIRNEDNPWEVEDKVIAHHHAGGYVLGIGTRVAITDSLSIFTEYNWREYVSRFSSLKTTYAGTDPMGTIDTIDTKITNAHSTSLSFGIAMSF